MLKNGHGNHWECITDLENLVTKHLSTLVKEGNVEDMANVRGTFFENGFETLEKVYAISYPKSELASLALLVHDKENQVNSIFCLYPFCRGGIEHCLRVEEIEEWTSGVEAIITGTTEGGHTVSFFDTKYYKNKETYCKGDLFTFSLSGLAYTAEKNENTSFKLEGERAIDWLAKVGESPTYDNDGNIESVVFDTRDLVTLLPAANNISSDYVFQSPATPIEEIEIFGKEMFKIRIQIFRDPDAFIYLFAQKKFFKNIPKNEDSIRGFLWLQGYLCK